MRTQLRKRVLARSNLALDTSRFARSLAADIRLKGLLSLFTFMVAGDIRALAVDAKAGMERAFAEGRHTAAAAAADSTAQ